jgi:hypothetical protein
VFIQDDVGGEGEEVPPGLEPMMRVHPVGWWWVSYWLEASTRVSLDLEKHTSISRMNGNFGPLESRGGFLEG